MMFRMLRPQLRALFAALAMLVAWSASARAQTAPTPGGQDFITKARQAVLMDFATGAILYQHKADMPAPPASMSKLMTVAVLYKVLKEGKLKPDDEFLMSENAWRRGGAPSGTAAMMVPVNTKAKLSDLLQGIVVQSGNDAAIAIAEGLAGSEEQFSKLMEAEAKRIGLRHSTFRNATGLYHPEHLMSVRDLAVLARHIIQEYPDNYAMYAQREFLYRRHKFANRNPLLALTIGVDGLKTGFIKEAGYGIVASAKQNERRLIAVVNGCTTAEERKEEARKLLEWGFRAFSPFKIFNAGEIVGQARVWGGDRMYVPLAGIDDVTVLLPRFPANQRLKAEIVYQGPLKTPIRKGDPVARLRVIGSTNTQNDVQLYAAEDVAPGPMWRRGIDSLAHHATRWFP
jgi:D-alanyl-D-alanine carboxypeptidase (penicillin-binding protein 5/6)